MNYFKQVAEMLGVELDEKFMLKDEDNDFLPRTYKITNRGLFYEFSGEWERSAKLLDIVAGYLTIVKSPLKPCHLEKYYVYSVFHKKALETNWQGVTEDFLYWKLGNCFRTKEEAETKGKDIMEQIKKEYEVS